VAVLCTCLPGHCEYDRDGTRHRQRRHYPVGNASRAPHVGRGVGDLPEVTIERLGLGLMRLEEAMGELREYFGLRPGDLILDLGLFGRYCRASPAESSRARF
jgi:gas vesicle protein GvpK